MNIFYGLCSIMATFQNEYLSQDFHDFWETFDENDGTNMEKVTEENEITQKGIE